MRMLGNRRTPCGMNGEQWRHMLVNGHERTNGNIIMVLLTGAHEKLMKINRRFILGAHRQWTNSISGRSNLCHAWTIYDP